MLQFCDARQISRSDYVNFATMWPECPMNCGISCYMISEALSKSCRIDRLSDVSCRSCFDFKNVTTPVVATIAYGVICLAIRTDRITIVIRFIQLASKLLLPMDRTANDLFTE